MVQTYAQEPVIVYAKRTPIGKFNGAFVATPAPELGATLIRDALAALQLKHTEVDSLLMGKVLLLVALP